jgi:hypothetical protein
VQVNFHRTHFDSKPHRNPLIRKSLRDEPSYFHLPFCQNLTAENVSGPLIFVIISSYHRHSFVSRSKYTKLRDMRIVTRAI